MLLVEGLKTTLPINPQPHNRPSMKTAPFLAALAAAFLLSAPASAQSSGAISFGKPKAAESAEFVTIQAKGQGETVEAAKKDAARNAVKKAVGELVDAKTLVENDELVEDRILVLSNAMIEKADYGDAASIGDGLFEVPVTAVVKKGRLNQELKAVGIATGAVAGDSLAAAMFTGKERIANAEKFFAERFKGFPGNVVEAVMLTKGDGSPDVEVDSETGHVFANVGLRVNMENYSEWARHLQEVLGAVCLEQEQTNLKFGESFEPSQVSAERLNFRKLPKSAMFVVVATPSAEKVGRSSWPATVYYLDAQMAKAFATQMAARIPEKGVLEVVLEDEDGEPVCSKTVGLTTKKQANENDGHLGYFHLGNRDSLVKGRGFAAIPTWAEYSASDDDLVFVVPVLNSLFGYDGHADPRLLRLKDDLTAKFRIDLGEVSEDDLGAVTGFKVKVEYTKSRP